MVYILLGTGFEEMEALAPCDILRRGGVPVKLAGVTGRKVRGGHGVEIVTDCILEDINLHDAEMIVIPGGLGGVESIEASAAAMQLIEDAYHRDIEVAAICAGPRVLARLGILEGKKAVCYPGMEGEMAGGKMTQKTSTVRDGKVTTGRGPGACIDFALKLLEILKDSKTAANVKEGLFYGKP